MISTFVERADSEHIFRNNMNHPCEITVWCCYPRKRATEGAIPETDWYGFEPSKLISGFTQVQTLDQTTALTGSEWFSTPFLSSQWCGRFKIHQKCNQILAPGGELRVVSGIPKSFFLSKKTFGVNDNTAISGQYGYIAQSGPIILVRVRGCIVHDETLADTDMVNQSTGATTGTYNVDVLRLYRYKFWETSEKANRGTGKSGSFAAIADINNESTTVTMAPAESKVDV